MTQKAQTPDIRRGQQDLSVYNTRPIRVIFVDGHYSVVHALHNSDAVEKAKLRHQDVDVAKVEVVR